MELQLFLSSCCNLIRNSFAPDVFTLRIVFLPNASFASNLCTVTYPCFVLCLTPVFVFKYRSTSSQTVICPSTIFTSISKSVFTCFSNSRRERHGFLPFGSLSVGSSFQLYTKCGFPSM